MTKKQTIEEVVAELNAPAVPTDEDKAYARSRDDFYIRDSALSYAMTYHKNNGGMLPIAQVVDHANVFLTFLKGETK